MAQMLHTAAWPWLIQGPCLPKDFGSPWGAPEPQVLPGGLFPLELDCNVPAFLGPRGQVWGVGPRQAQHLEKW